MTSAPIFIHSLFRAGSTYLFNVFRRSQHGYWCYQEPLHEFVCANRLEPAPLLAIGAEEAKLYRHPILDHAYWSELVEVWPAWKDAISEPVIYDAYFANPSEAEIGIAYWQALAAAAKGRPIFQECRTAGRMAAIKSQMGGQHIYLWRNPWDQWWSYKVTPYFDTVNQLIIRASHAPAPVGYLRKALGMEDEIPGGLSEAFVHFGAKPVGSEKSYLVFYMLWCLGLHEGMTHSDLMLNIDRLSDSIAYRNEMQHALLNLDIPSIDFSDCRVPQGRYLEQDQIFFEPLEEQVHQWLLRGGWSSDQLVQVQSIRHRFEPTIWGEPLSLCILAELAEQGSRARALVRRYETSWVENVNTLSGTIGEAKAMQAEAESRAAVAEAKAMQVEAESRAAVAEAKAMQAEAESRAAVAEAKAMQAEAESRAAVAEAKVMQAETQWKAVSEELNDVRHAHHHQWLQLEATRKELHDVHRANHYHWQLAEARQQQIHAFLNSTSWRVTAPLRWVCLSSGLFSTEILKQKTKLLLQHIALYIGRRSHFKKIVLAGLNRFPIAKAWLKQQVVVTPVAVQAQVRQNQPQLEVPDRADLTPRARQIYVDLKSALERYHKENA